MEKKDDDTLSGIRSVAANEPGAGPPDAELGARLRALEEKNAALWSRLRELDPAARDDPSSKAPGATLIVVSSAKGGVGKSVIAANLAAGLVEYYGQRTALVDASLEFGDQAVLFNIHSGKSLAHLAGISSVDERVASDLLTPHASGLSIVASPPDPIFAEQISPSVVADLVRSYQAQFDFIIVDTRSGFGELNLQLLEAADIILLVATPEMNTAAHTAHFLELARRLGHGDKIRLILNRSNTGLKTEVVANFLDIPVSSSVVSGGEAFIRAANTGESLFNRDPEGKETVTRDLRGLVADVIGRTSGPAMSPVESGVPSSTGANAGIWNKLLRPRRRPLTQIASDEIAR